MTVVSYFKLVVTLVKYVPQAILNFRRQSTHGWSITAILLDATGGVLSITQLFIDSSLAHQPVQDNLSKLLLGAFSLAFDGIFITQHYCLYADAASIASDDHLSDHDDYNDADSGHHSQDNDKLRLLTPVPPPQQA